MSKEDWVNNTVDKIFGDVYPKDVDSILDLGCGLSCKSQYLSARVKVGVDIYRPYLLIASVEYDGALICHDITKIKDLFLYRSFDVILLLDVVEHLQKEQSLQLIADCEQIAKKAVIIETPLGYIPQNIDIWGHGGDKYQTHRSGWTKEEFYKMGYLCKLRDYKMQDVKRHTDMDVKSDIQIIDAIKLL
jgi:cyclopropane fatty-acyl-phospholipid synthase-like methyltransferase